MIKDTSSQDVIITPARSWKGNAMKALMAIICLILVVIAYPSIANWSSSDLSISAERVRLAKVKRGDFTRDYALQGNIVAAHSPKLYSPAQGHVTLLVNPGQTVVRGELIAQINSPELNNRLLQEKSKLESLQIELERTRIEAKQAQIRTSQQIKLEKVVLEAAKREMRRAKQSITIDAISQIDFEKAVDDLKRAELKYEFAVEQAGLEQEKLAFEIKTRQFEYNQYQLLVDNTSRLVESLNITAPVKGIVGSWAVEQKSAVQINQALLTIVDLSTFEVELDIPESFADEIGIGMDAYVTYNNQQYPARIASISPEVNDNIVKGRLAFSEQTPPGIKQNQRVSSRVILQQKKDVLFLPRGSFIQHHGGKSIFLVKDGVAELKEITLGAHSIDKVEVIAGLTENQQVIISNTDFVQKAQRLTLN
ncbi:efflux RND transporter periplasmic adaptor subunit [Aliikangiella sp. IMCC44653]